MILLKKYSGVLSKTMHVRIPLEIASVGLFILSFRDLQPLYQSAHGRQNKIRLFITRSIVVNVHFGANKTERARGFLPPSEIPMVQRTRYTSMETAAVYDTGIYICTYIYTYVCP